MYQSKRIGFVRIYQPRPKLRPGIRLKINRRLKRHFLPTARVFDG
jgi:hypothetical protein